MWKKPALSSMSMVLRGKSLSDNIGGYTDARNFIKYRHDHDHMECLQTDPVHGILVNTFFSNNRVYTRYRIDAYSARRP